MYDKILTPDDLPSWEAALKSISVPKQAPGVNALIEQRDELKKQYDAISERYSAACDTVRGTCVHPFKALRIGRYYLSDTLGNGYYERNTVYCSACTQHLASARKNGRGEVELTKS